MARPVARLAMDRRILALLQQCAVLATGFVSGIALAQDLGPVDRGHYSVIQTLYVLATPALSLGVPLKLMAPSAMLRAGGSCVFTQDSRWYWVGS